MIYLLVQYSNTHTNQHIRHIISNISIRTNDYAFVSIIRMIPLIRTPNFYVLNDTQIDKQISCQKFALFWG